MSDTVIFIISLAVGLSSLSFVVVMTAFLCCRHKEVRNWGVLFGLFGLSCFSVLNFATAYKHCLAVREKEPDFFISNAERIDLLQKEIRELKQRLGDTSGVVEKIP